VTRRTAIRPLGDKFIAKDFGGPGGAPEVKMKHQNAIISLFSSHLPGKRLFLANAKYQAKSGHRDSDLIAWGYI
jgi:hypothetical protein